MSIPYNPQLSWKNYQTNPKGIQAPEPLQQRGPARPNQESWRALTELFAQTFQQPFVRGLQCIRDVARLALKVPVRSTWTPIVLPKNWKQRERAMINAKLAGYAVVQLASVPARFAVALAALASSAISQQKARFLLDCSESYTDFLDGRCSQLEALKEEGRKNAVSQVEYNAYKNWLYQIDPSCARVHS